jgi:glycine cleavage system H protein
MDFPEELKYSKEHIWVRVEGNKAVIGITDYAQMELGKITGVELPDVGDELDQEDSFGSVEARKTVAELYAPLTGQVLEVNEELLVSPELLNEDSGWIAIINISDHEELNLLMSVEDYVDSVNVFDEVD